LWQPRQYWLTSASPAGGAVEALRERTGAGEAGSVAACSGAALVAPGFGAISNTTPAVPMKTAAEVRSLARIRGVRELSAGDVVPFVMARKPPSAS
jgi:hypothetical protein